MDKILAILLAILLAGGLAVTGQAQAKPSAYECDLNRLAAEAAATETLHSLRDSEKAKNTLIVGGSCLGLLMIAAFDMGGTALICTLVSASAFSYRGYRLRTASATKRHQTVRDAEGR
jgi:hypothetical protein